MAVGAADPSGWHLFRGIQWSGQACLDTLRENAEERPAAHLFGKAAKSAGRGPGRGPVETDHVRCLYAYLSFDLWQQCRGFVY